MSADNWRVCPNCHKTYKPAKSPYGELPEEDYITWLENHEDEEEPYNLREDWELSVDLEFNLYVRYSCHCKECGWSYEIIIDKNIEDEGSIKKW